MNPRQFAQFLGFYFYVLNVNAANDAQRVILLSSLIQIRALQAQLLLWNQRRRRRRGRRFPCFWVLPRPQQSWFDIHYFDATIPGDYFRRQLRLNRNTFSVLIEYSSPAPDKTKHALAWLCDTGKTFGIGTVSLGTWKFLHNDRPKF